MDEKKVLLLVNPFAGKLKSQSKMMEILRIFCDHDYQVTVRMTRSRGDATEYAAQHADQFDLVVCCGGDGTLNETLNGLMQLENRPMLGYLPAGTTNDFASSLKLAKQLPQAALRAVEGEPMSLDVGLFQDRYFSYITSFGAFTRSSYSTSQKMKNTFGHMAYIIEGLKDVGSIKPIPLAISYVDENNDKQELEGEFLFGAVSNSTSVAGLFKIKEEDVSFNDGVFEVMLINNLHNPAEFTRAVQNLFKKKYDPRYVRFLHAKEIHIHAETPLAWTVDGEAGGEYTDVTIRNLPGAIQLVK